MDQRGWYFTAAWEPVAVRRGDALGLRPAADYFADLLAPGLSNSTSDARWISILAWSLQWSHVVWRNAGGGDLSRRDEQRDRYAWLRPLELLWIARSLESGKGFRQLRGRRSVRRWLGSGGRLPNFAMSADQYRRYRQAGMYGAYRVVLRSVPGLTSGDGWTPAEAGIRLARLVNEGLPRAARLRQEQLETGRHWSRWRGGDEARYWVEHGWPEAWATRGGLVPTTDDEIRHRLPEPERALLETAIFGTETIRRATAEELGAAREAATHADLCDAIANSSVLADWLQPNALACLPAFTRLADAATHAMRGLWSAVNQDDAQQAPPIEKLARSVDLRSRLERLREMADLWLNSTRRSAFPHQDVATRLAESIRVATTPAEQVRAMSKHHHQYGGGRRWFREQSGSLVPLVADTGIAAADYRFRLRSLALLAGQCGVANMNVALDAVEQQDLDDDEGDAL